MFGLGAAAGRTTSRLLAVSQGSGHGDRVGVVAFQRLLRVCPGLRTALFVYADSAAMQMSQNTACMAFHSAQVRLARWMLDVTDGLQSARLSSTQAAIATALGLQRPAVSVAAAELQRSGLIRYLRGDVTILDRVGLRAAACKCSIRRT
jgi:CRP-like cAMP-binding protein